MTTDLQALTQRLNALPKSRPWFGGDAYDKAKAKLIADTQQIMLRRLTTFPHPNEDQSKDERAYLKKYSRIIQVTEDQYDAQVSVFEGHVDGRLGEISRKIQECVSTNWNELDHFLAKGNGLAGFSSPAIINGLRKEEEALEAAATDLCAVGLEAPTDEELQSPLQQVQNEAASTIAYLAKREDVFKRISKLRETMKSVEDKDQELSRDKLTEFNATAQTCRFKLRSTFQELLAAEKPGAVIVGKMWENKTATLVAVGAAAYVTAYVAVPYLLEFAIVQKLIGLTTCALAGGAAWLVNKVRTS